MERWQHDSNQHFDSQQKERLGRWLERKTVLSPFQPQHGGSGWKRVIRLYA